MKRTLAAALAAVAFAAAAPAYAADFILTDDFLIDADPLTGSHFYVTSASATNVSATLTNNVGVATFSDRYIFAPTFFGSGSGAAVTNLDAQLLFGIPGLRIDGYALTAPIQAALFDAFSTGDVTAYNNDVSTVATFLGSASAVFSQVGIPSGLDRQLFSVPLDPANFYVITIDGEGFASNSLYSGNLSATSVPEPATWAMMLAGFGLIGFAMRRQRQSHPKVRFAF
jgi:hypothetical protein